MFSDAVFIKGDEFEGKKVPPEALQYPQNNATNVFLSKKVFEKKHLRIPENPLASTFARNSVFVTKFPLPGMLRWSEVVQQLEAIETTPIENTLSMLQEKNLDLQMSWLKLINNPNSVSIKTIGQQTKGTVIPEVGGGLPKIEEAFFTDSYINQHPEDKEYIELLKDEFKRQVWIIDQLLPLHGQYASEESKFLQQAMEEEFQKTKEHVDAKYGEWSHGEEFRVHF